MKKKNILALMLAMVFVGSMSSCNEQNEPSPSNSTSENHSDASSATSNSTSLSSNSESISSTTSSPSTSSSPSVSVDIPELHQVNISGAEGAYVMINHPEAAKDTAMEVTVVITDAKYVLKEVRLGETILNSQVDPTNDKVTKHGFIMPDEDVTIRVETFIPTKDYLVSFEKSDVVDIIGLNEGANEGDIVNFKLRTLSGYAIDMVSAYYTNENSEKVEVDVFHEGNGEYSLIMPKGNVTIVSEASGAFFKISVDNETSIVPTADGKTSYGNSWTAADFVDEIGILGSDNMITSSSGNKNEALIQAGTKGIFVINRVGDNTNYSSSIKPDAIATHYYVDGLEVYPIEIKGDDYGGIDYAYEFMMPNKNTEITVECIERSLSVSMDLPEQLEGHMYTIDENGNETIISNDTEVKLGDTIYYTASMKEDVNTADFRYESTYLSIPVYASNNAANTREDVNASKRVAWDETKSGSYDTVKSTSTAGVKYFTVPNLYYVDNKITIKFVVKDLHFLENTPILGNWYGREIYKKNPQSTIKDLIIKADGSLTTSADSSAKEVSEVNFDEGKVVLSSGKEFNYVTSGDKSYGYLPFYSTLSLNDFYLFVKCSSETFKTLTIVGYGQEDSKSYVVAIYDANKALYGALWVDGEGSEPTITLDVNITMTEGSNISAEGAKFVVSKGDITYLVVE